MLNTDLLALEQLGERDVRFVVESVVEQPGDRERVERLARAEPAALEAMLDDPRLVGRVVREPEILLKISPYLLFAVLLRQVRRDLQRTGFTIEWAAPRERVPVFDTGSLTAVLDDAEIRHYLAELLASFTRIESTAVTVQGPQGRERWQFSDPDLQSLIRLGVLLPHAERLAVFRRVGDLALFLTGVFPDYTGHQSLQRRPGQVMSGGTEGQRGRQAAPPLQRSAGPDEHLEELGRRYYRMAARHPNAGWLGWEDLCHRLSEEFPATRKVLNLLADLYIHRLRFDWFPAAGKAD